MAHPDNASSRRIMIDLKVLADGMPGLTPALGQMLAEAASVCLDSHQHISKTNIYLIGDEENTCELMWEKPDIQTKRAYDDLQESTEFGACGIAILLSLKILKKFVIGRSRKGTGFDYWLSDINESIFFEGKVRLEVSGILNGNNNSLEYRVTQKINQISKYPNPATGYVAVIEFSRPVGYLGKV